MVALSVTVSQGGRLPALALGKPAVHRLARQIAPSDPRTRSDGLHRVLRNPHIVGGPDARYLAIHCESGRPHAAGAPGRTG